MRIKSLDTAGSDSVSVAKKSVTAKDLRLVILGKHVVSRLDSLAFLTQEVGPLGFDLSI